MKLVKMFNDAKINKKMIPIKLFGALYNLAINITFPYLTLQMTQIGLNVEDVSIIYGVTPLMTFLAAPIAGKSTNSYVTTMVVYDPKCTIHTDPKVPMNTF